MNAKLKQCEKIVITPRCFEMIMRTTPQCNNVIALRGSSGVLIQECALAFSKLPLPVSHRDTFHLWRGAFILRLFVVFPAKHKNHKLNMGPKYYLYIISLLVQQEKLQLVNQLKLSMFYVKNREEGGLPYLGNCKRPAMLKISIYMRNSKQ